MYGKQCYVCATSDSEEPMVFTSRKTAQLYLDGRDGASMKECVLVEGDGLVRCRKVVYRFKWSDIRKNGETITSLRKPTAVAYEMLSLAFHNLVGWEGKSYAGMIRANRQDIPGNIYPEGYFNINIPHDESKGVLTILLPECDEKTFDMDKLACDLMVRAYLYSSGTPIDPSRSFPFFMKEKACDELDRVFWGSRD